ncbi:MAG: ABC transporter substrate-binding protein [Deltaproteobacteria bacterium]|nr:ABC transporter substrate-binding protein [Deltaproteobacteria bacterium]
MNVPRLSRVVGWLTVVALAGGAALPAWAGERLYIGNVTRNVEQLPTYAAVEKGFFTQEGIRGEVILIGSTDTLIQALVAGSIQGAVVDPTGVIIATERGASLKIIGGTVPVAPYTLLGYPRYKSIPELKGTTIGVVSLVSGSTVFLREMLKAHGLQANRDYTMLQLGPTDQRLVSLQTGRISATMILGGDLYRALELGFTNLGRLQDYIPNLQFHSLNVDGRWAEANSQLVVRYLRAMLRALQWVHTHKDEAAELATKRTGIDRKYTRPTVEEYTARGIFSRDGSVNQEGFQRLIDLLGESLFKQRPYPPPDKYLDMRYLRLAQRDLGPPAGR